MNIWDRVIEIAKDSNCKKRNVGCVITSEEGQYISHGYNYHIDGKCDCIPGPGTAVHAEVDAINNIPVYDRTRDDLVAYISHKPCDKCMSLLNAICKEVVVKELSPKLTDTIESTLEERAKTHGDFSESSRFVQSIKVVMQATPNWDILEDDQREALHMIQHKIGRILYGNPDYEDNWHDLCGYAKLIERRLNGLQ